MHMVSTILSSNSILPSYDLATSFAASKNNPSVYFIMFALWTAVTFLLLFFTAYSKANLTILLEPSTEMGFMLIAESGFIFFLLRPSKTVITLAVSLAPFL